MSAKAFFISIPHSGERIPEEATWLQGLPEALVMCDVDRFVDRLYAPAMEALYIPHVVAEWHRYSADLNRLPSDVDQDSVQGSENPPGTHPIGLHWSVTTRGDRLMPRPISQELHRLLVKKYHEPFHEQVRSKYKSFKDSGFEKVYHLDAHSMPSLGTRAHPDPGERRAEIVVSDLKGKSCEASFMNLVVESFRRAGFQVACNWPYVGGRVTQTYGHPDQGQHTIQVEMNRALYMDESTKAIKEELVKPVQEKVTQALTMILAEL